MTKKAKLAIEISEKRQALNTLLAKDELSTEERAEMAALTARLQELEPELRAAIVAEESHETRTEGTGEGAELRALADRCNMGAIFAAVLEHRNVEGPERELQSHLRPGRQHDSPRPAHGASGRHVGAGASRAESGADHCRCVPGQRVRVPGNRHCPGSPSGMRYFRCWSRTPRSKPRPRTRPLPRPRGAFRLPCSCLRGSRLRSSTAVRIGHGSAAWTWRCGKTFRWPWPMVWTRKSWPVVTGC